MLDPSASGDPLPRPDTSRRGDAGSRNTGGRARALIVGMLAAMLAGIGIGIVIGNGARKRIDRWGRRGY